MKLLRNTYLFIFSSFIAQAQHGIMIDSFQTFDSYSDIKYDEVLRPQFHFSSKKNWINDPNGLVYYKGEYHLYFQHNPKGTRWGNMTWGHAVSKDMVRWEQIAHAILPYGNGTIYSGTAAVDYPNSLKKNTPTEQAIVAYFTHAQKSKNDPYYQAGAYSTDRGRTFQLIDGGRPLLKNQGYDRGERDPKIFWHAPSNKWVMVLWIKRGDKKNTADLGKVRFFSSDDLKNWNVLSDFDRRWVYECMDMVPLKVDGDPDKIKWLIYDASFDYEVGAFDGTTLTTDKTTLLGDYGDAYYAAQTFNNSPDDRTVIIGWLKTKKNNIFWDNNMPFNQQMAFPATLELKNTSLGLRLFRWPVEEIKSLYEKSQIYENVKKTSLNRKMKKINFDGVDLYGAFDRRQNADFTINIRGNILKYENGNFYFEGKTLPTLKNDKVNFRVLLDRATIEIFTDNGFSVLSNYTSPNTENTSINISSEKNMIFDSFEVHKVGSIWQ